MHSAMIDKDTESYETEPRATYDKKLRYRRGTARRAVSVETVRNVAQMFVELHLKIRE